MLEELEAYERDVHPCGYHKSQIEDGIPVTPHVDKCPICAGAASYARILHAEDEAARKKRGENTPPGAPLPSDGRRFWMRPMTPDEVDQARAVQAARLQGGSDRQEPAEAAEHGQAGDREGVAKPPLTEHERDDEPADG